MKIYLAVHSIRCPNTVGAAGEGFVAVVALDRLDGGGGGDHPLQGDGRHGAGSEAGGDGDDDYIRDDGDDVSGFGDSDVSANVLANLDATGVTGSGNLKCWPTPPLLELDTPGRAVHGGVFDVTIT